MKESVNLKCGAYSVCYLPDKGMNFISLKKGEVEALDLSTAALFEERYAGLGALIGPHFHHRNPAVIPPVPHPERFPFIKPGSDEPFSHGIGRYAPWTVEKVTENQLKAVLRGDDVWHEVPLKTLEGQDFTMDYTATLTEEGLAIELAVRGETECVVGLHTYYALSGGKGVVSGRVREKYNDMGTFKPIPSTWNYASEHTLILPFDTPVDYGFLAYPDPLHGEMVLETATHRMRVQSWCDNEEHSMQVWHPEGASFACVEPIAAKNPRKPRLTVAQLKILISIL